MWSQTTQGEVQIPFTELMQRPHFERYVLVVATPKNVQETITKIHQKVKQTAC